MSSEEGEITGASRPGAVHVGERRERDEEYTVTAPPDETPVAPRISTRGQPLTARLVRDTEEDFEQIQYQLQQQGQPLQQVLAGLNQTNKAAPLVISHDGEAIPVSSTTGNEAKQSTSHLGHPRKRCVIIVGVMVVVAAAAAAAAGVVIPIIVFKSTPAAADDSAQTPGPQACTGDTLTALLSKVSLDGGAALRGRSTPQNAALHWLAGNAKLNEYSDERKIQRYVLATFYHSTNGGNWDNNGGWMSDMDECEWFNDAEGPFCWNGVVVEFDFFQNNLRGTIPEELALLSSSIGKICL
jgi:hypothetical protein